MDLATARKQFAEKEAVRDRIAADLARVREQLAGTSQASRAAQAAAREAQVAAVIEGSKEAQEAAARAKAAVVATFEAETVLKDQVPVLDHALGHLTEELRRLQGQMKAEEDARLTAMVAATKPAAVEALREAAARCLLVYFGGRSPADFGHVEIGMLLEDFIGRGAGRQDVNERVQVLRSKLRAEAVTP